MPAPDVISNYIQYTDTELYSIEARDLRHTKKELLLAPISGIAINTPNYINTTEQQSLPLLLASKINGLKSWSTPLPDNTYLSTFDHSTGNISISTILISEKAQHNYQAATPNEMEKPREEDAESDGVSIDILDLRNKFNIPWTEGKWTFRALYFDNVSKAETVTLSTQAITEAQTSTDEKILRGKTLNENDDAIIIPLKATIGTKPTDSVYKPELQMTSFYQTANKHNNQLSDSLLIKGKLKQLQQPTLATLVLLKRNDARPTSIKLHLLPSKQDLAADTLYSSFSFDLLALRKKTILEKGDYVMYLFIGANLIGPAHFNVPE